MRSIGVATLVVIIITVGLLSPAMAQRSVIRVACIGNSITFGGMGEQSYPQQLGKLLGAHYSVKNFGVSGTTLLKKGDFPYWNEAAFFNAQDFKPQILILCLGTNDSKPQNWIFKDEYSGDYLAMIQVFRGLNPNVQIFACSPPPVFKDGYGITNSIIRDEIIPLVRQLRATAGVDSIDFYNRMLDQGTHFPDGIHPDAAGYAVMAQIAQQAILQSSSGYIRYFEASPTSFEKGGACTLYWETTIQSQATINGIPVAEADSMIVQPTNGTGYALITHGSISDTARVALTYLPPGRIKSFIADPVDLDLGSGDSTLLRWSATSGSMVTLDGLPVENSGSRSVAPAQTTEYTLIAAGEETDTLRVTVWVLPSDQINRAFNCPVQVSASERGNQPSWAVDGDTLTAWRSGPTGSQWINIDLGSMHQINRVLLHWGRCYGVVYHLQSLDEAGKMATVYSNTKGDGGIDDIGGLNGSGRYLRLLCITKSRSDSALVLDEFEVYGSRWATGVEGSDDGIPLGYALWQNHPNPFNPSTTISFLLPQRGPVELKVFDMLGRECGCIVNGTLASGIHQYEFQAGPLPSGIYYYQLKAGPFEQIRKMILLR